MRSAITRQGQDFGDPAAVDFLFNLNPQHRQRLCRDYGTSSRMCEQKRSGAARWLRKQPTALTLSPDQWHRPSVEGDDGIAAEPCAMRRDDATGEVAARDACSATLGPGAWCDVIARAPVSAWLKHVLLEIPLFKNSAHGNSGDCVSRIVGVVSRSGTRVSSEIQAPADRPLSQASWRLSPPCVPDRLAEPGRSCRAGAAGGRRPKYASQAQAALSFLSYAAIRSTQPASPGSYRGTTRLRSPLRRGRGWSPHRSPENCLPGLPPRAEETPAGRAGQHYAARVPAGHPA